VGPRGSPEPAWEEIVKLTLSDLYRMAEGYEAELERDHADDHPAWLQERAARIRLLIVQKERALEHREEHR
jgi:hypothetical protein